MNEPFCFNPKCMLNEYYIHPQCQKILIKGRYFERVIVSHNNSLGENKNFVLCLDCSRNNETVKEVADLL